MKEVIVKLHEELEIARKVTAEKQKDYLAAIRKERNAANRLYNAWAGQHEKIISTIKSIAGE